MGILSRHSGSIDQTFKGYLNFPAVLQAVAVMVIFRYIPYNRLNERFVRDVENNIKVHIWSIFDAHLFCVAASSNIDYQFFKHLFSYEGCSSDLRHMYIAVLDAVKSSCAEQDSWMLIRNRGAL